MDSTKALENSNVPQETPQGTASTSEIKDLARNFASSLYIYGEDGFRVPTVPPFVYAPLGPDWDSARLLVLHPADDAASHIRCDLETHPLTNLPPYVAIKNARGYRHLVESIEVNGRELRVTVALERYLRYYRTTIKEPTRIWVRYICVQEFDLDEQKRYWTRDFSDIMYAMALEVFDMHETNSRLIESGYFETVVDLRFKYWTKTWNGTPEEVVLPKVCPVRLGVKPNNEEPTMEYQYMPLDMIANEIRVMCIMPAEDLSAPIVIHAAHCPIRCGVTFSALSYRWGTDETPEEIVLNGQKKLIRKNLAEAIRDIRMEKKIVPVWIDALSINQHDTVERRRQVPRIGTIYDNATGVISNVGEKSTYSTVAFDFVKQLIQHPMVRTNDKGEFHFGPSEYMDGIITYGENTITPEQLGPMCAALYKFLTRQYFRRCWVLQEVAWASNPVILAGRGTQIKFDDLDMAIYNFQDMLSRDMTLIGQMQEADPSLTAIDVNMLAFPRKLFYFRHLVSKGECFGNGLRFVTVKSTAPGFLEALVIARDFECDDPRDHIFALWNLAQDKTGLAYKPSYEKAYEEVYADLTQAWTEQHQKLDILGAVEASQQSESFYQEAPTWCPNWNTPATTSSLIRKDYIPAYPMFTINDQDGALYSADGGLHRDSFEDHHSLFHFENGTLFCTGIVVDQIKLILDDALEIPDGTRFPPCDPESNWRFRCWTEELANYYGKYELTTYEDPLRAAWAMFHGDSPAVWQPQESGYSPDTYHYTEPYVCIPSVSRHVQVYGASYERAQAWSVVKTVIRGRRPFITDNGFMGLAPAYITEMKDDGPWLLTILAGCSVPLLLRAKDDGRYQLVGACFVQGWMEGEWMETMMGAESPKEFWEAIINDAELKIA
ncbi:hypothetical protein CC80DRAFT_599520 [Byssothecium circinans]|uniref:Heterokaryon incompatibility domain-containing protein n=1 Tax=Byssothecium circinans TaxID=147558 RepID=A0A6A5TD03_9PLEO|nr:hypothetical protein CC80DRAFT_599520 [Byssothecium circinans]